MNADEARKASRWKNFSWNGILEAKALKLVLDATEEEVWSPVENLMIGRTSLVLGRVKQQVREQLKEEVLGNE